MKSTKKNNSYQSFDCMRAFRDSIEPEAMHPDDYSAHRAWVAAKRSHERGTGQVS
ncbi:MAG: hypothetical protein LUQ71_09620 [Methanoregula sp.]|jgi:hypothetical protein|nr:hypothetical protein [Methanoregula sp.]